MYFSYIPKRNNFVNILKRITQFFCLFAVIYNVKTKLLQKSRV